MITYNWIRLIGVFVFALATTVAVPAAEKGSKSERRASKSEAASAAKIDINTADAATLETLPGVGPATAAAIVKARPFTSVDDLERVPGIGPSRLDDLRDRVTVSSSGARSKGAAKKSATATEKAARRSSETPAARSADRDSHPSASTKATARGGKVDVNTAGIEELESLPGVGPQTAKAIVAGRPYTSVDDLERVAGIGPARLQELRGRVTVSSRATTSTSRREAASERRERDLEPTGRTTTSTREPAASGGHAKVNLNTATLEELEALPEIGPVRARAIIEARPFTSVDDLKRVKGIKDIRLEELRPHVTVR